MRNVIVTLITLILSFLLQCCVVQGIAIGTIVPNILVILCVSMGILRGKRYGMYLGFCTGLLVDIFFGPLPGFHALIYMYIGYFSGSAYLVCYDDDIKVPLLFTALFDLLYNIAVYTLRFLLRGRMGFALYLKRIMIPEMLYTVLVTIILYRVYYLINHRLMKNSRRERKSVWEV